MKKYFAIAFLITCSSICLWAQKPTKQMLQKGKIVYEQYCLACHQVDGSGVPHLNPPLVKTSFVLGDKKSLIGIVLNGLSDVEVDGETYSNPMPGFNFLTDEEVANVLTYVRNSFTNKATAVTIAEVKSSR